jgi:ERCC4-type nuclease
MDFKFIHSKLFRENSSQFTFYLFYLGYDLHKFTSDLLDELNLNNRSIFMINFNDKIIDKLNREGSHKITVTETNKRHQLYLNPNGVFCLSSKVLLLDLITNKLSSDSIDYLIISNGKSIENDSKEIFILKYLTHNTQKTKFIFINNNVINFTKDFEVMKVNKLIPEQNKFKINFLSRNHQLVDKTVEYSLNLKNIQIFENNSFNLEIDEIQQKLILLYNNCLSELKRLTIIPDHPEEKFLTKIFEIFKLEDILSENSYSTINFLVNNLSSLITYKSRLLIRDLTVIKNLLLKIDYLDVCTLLNNFNSIVRESEENSFLKYKDSDTLNLIDSIQDILKKKIFTIKKYEAPIGLEGLLTNEYVEKVIDLNERNLMILQNYELSLNPSIYSLNPKMTKLIEILNNINSDSHNKKENILILTNSQQGKDNIKEILSSFFILKDNGETFFEKKIRNFLTSKVEFQKRQKIISSQSLNFIVSNANQNNNITNSNSYVSPVLTENLLLHKLCIDLCFKYDIKNENIFEKLLMIKNSLVAKNDSKDDDMPSEIEVSENLFIKLDSTAFDEKGKNILPPHHIFVENFYFDDSAGVDLKELIINENISIVIFHHFNLEILRLIELVISNNDESCIKQIHILNTKNSFNFKKETRKVKDEFLNFKRVCLSYYKNKDRENIELNDSCRIIIDKTEDFPENKICNTQSANLNKKKNIVIDFREMSSKLPFYLYDYGFNLVVGGLDIGDYITSNTVVIERKSLTTGDLIESLKSGRLMNQIVKMQKYFEHLIILCEFEDDMEVNIKDPSNTNLSNINKSDSHFFRQKFLYKKFIELNSVSSKIHVFWSKNPKMTSVILNMLKNKFNDFLDVQRCLNINKKDSSVSNNISQANNAKQSISSSNNNHQKSIVSFFGGSSTISQTNIEESKKSSNEEIVLNSSAVNLSYYEEEVDNFDPIKKLEINIERFIRKVDGININNYGLISKNFSNLKEFVLCSRDKLNTIFGKNGNKIFFFLNSRFSKSTNNNSSNYLSKK